MDFIKEVKKQEFDKEYFEKRRGLPFKIEIGVADCCGEHVIEKYGILNIVSDNQLKFLVLESRVYGAYFIGDFPPPFDKVGQLDVFINDKIYKLECLVEV